MTFDKNESLKFSFKKKLGILEKIKKPDASYEQLQEYLEYAEDPALTKPILKTIFANLVLEDTVISAAYYFTEEEEWESMFSDCDASAQPPADSKNPSDDPKNSRSLPPDDPKNSRSLPESGPMNSSSPMNSDSDSSAPSSTSEETSILQQRVDNFTKSYLLILEFLRKQKLGVIKEIITPLYLNRTKNVQFILFDLCKSMPIAVFGYLFENLKKEPLIYSPYYVSLLVRFSLDPDFKLKCFQFYFDYVSSLPLSRRIESVLLSQGLLYVLCFNPDYLELPDVKKFISRLHESGNLELFNRKIVERFCNIFGYKMPARISPLKNSCLDHFPFDLPVIRKIKNLVQKNYVKFSK